MKMLSGTLVLLFLTVAARADSVVQRADSCVVMEVAEARSEEGQHVWKFELKHPGAYVVQFISAVDEAEADPSATVGVDGKETSHSLTKAYVIEDGLVWEGEAPVVFSEAGLHELSVRSVISPLKARLVPQGYSKSRIKISSNKYYEEWIKMHQSPEKQAAMAWYKKARFGMFIHWGVYSEAAGSWKGTRIEDSPLAGPRVAEWLMFTFQISREEYREFAKSFNPERSFAANVAQLAKKAGMKYVVITSKHHDGFGLFDSACSDFDVIDASPYEGDLIKELYDACRAEGLDFGIYYSHGHDWMDGCDGNLAAVKKANDALGVPTRPNGKNIWDPSPNSFTEYLEGKAFPQIEELLELLPELRLIWFDGDGLVTEAQAFRFYKVIYDHDPGIIVNRRVGYDFGDYVDAGDNKTPAASELAAKHFETCGTANHSWGFKAHDHGWKSTNELLRNFVDIVSKGGNYLLNIGPDGEGQVPEPCVKGFEELGVWVKTNEDAVFGTGRWTTFNEGVPAPDARGRVKKAVKERAPSPTEFWFSAKEDKVYVMSLCSPKGKVRVLSLGEIAGKVVGLRVLGCKQAPKWSQTTEALEVDMSSIATGAHGYALEVTIEHPSR